jgi:hypothetical protein
MGAGAVICGRCGTEHASPSAGGDETALGVAGREYRAPGSSPLFGFFFNGALLLLLLGIGGGLGWLFWRQLQQGRQARTMTEMRRVADLLDKYRDRYHRYPQAHSMDELEKQLKGLAQQQTNDQLLSKLKLKVAIPNEPVEPPPEPVPQSAASPPSTPAAPSAAIPRPGEIDPLNRSLGSQLPARPAEPPPILAPSSPRPADPGDDEEKMRREMERMQRDMKREMPDVEMPTGAPNILGKLNLAKVPHEDEWGHGYQYLAFGSDYVLVSPGSDGRFEHDDLSQYEKKSARRYSQDLVIRSGDWLQAPDKAP